MLWLRARGLLFHLLPQVCSPLSSPCLCYLSPGPPRTLHVPSQAAGIQFHFQMSASLSCPHFTSSLVQARALPQPSHDSSALLFFGRFNQADSKNLQAITRKPPRSVLGNVFHCFRLPCSINSVKLLLPAGVKDGQILCPLLPRLRLHQRRTSWKPLISFKLSTFFSY